MDDTSKLADKYERIINTEYNGVRRHAHMPNINRAAQFAPFAALSGHMALINEKARYVEPEQVFSDEDI